MKKIIMLAACSLFALGVFAQSNNIVSAVIASDNVNYGQIAYLIACESGLVDENTSEKDAIITLEEKYPEFKKAIPTQTSLQVLSAKQFSFMITRVWNIKTSLLYMIFKSPRYAFRELKAQGYFDAGTDPDAGVSGRRALIIIADCAEKFEGAKK
ncbi:MAG: hypothetical protein K5839_00350 [Treponemataceae bacterium]|nr:hypothetical protein [Treponemataceae bacterium]